jgi:hypothetical protein
VKAGTLRLVSVEKAVKVALIVGGILGILLLLELGLRWRFGFGHPLLYQADPEIGYVLAPRQRTRRFGNRIEINQYSMRSPSISLNRPQNTLRVLLLGDSVANGGWWTDQSQTISALLRQHLQRELSRSTPSISFEPVNQIEVLNASANSWGPRNELAYLQRFGSFESQVIVLIINTDDLFAAAPTSVQVGRDRNYPARKPLLAITEVIQRYLMRQPPIPELEAVQQEVGDRVGINVAAIGQIQDLAQRSDAQFLLVLTPLLREVGEPGSRDYEQKARQRLMEFTQRQNIHFIDALKIFNHSKNPSTFYHDHIHLNGAGNQQIMETIAGEIQSTWWKQ